MDQPASVVRRTPWLELLLLFIGSRGLVLLIMWLSPMILAQGQFANPTETWLSRTVRWDATWFAGIAQEGYKSAATGYTDIAFFPFYPLLIRAVSFIFGHPVAVGFVLSNLAFFCTLVLLWKLIEEDAAGGETGLVPGDGSRAVRLLAFGPVSFFFSLIYSEATFLFLVVVAIYAARRRIWWLAGLAGLAASLTRNAGLFLAAPLIVEFFQLRFRRPWFTRPASLLPALYCLLPLLGIVLWSAFLEWRFGDGLLFLKGQGAWGRKLTPPWVPFEPSHLWNFPLFHQRWFVGHAIAGIVFFAIACWARLRPSYLVLAGLMLLLNLSANHLEAIPRLLSVIFPFYLGQAVLFRRWPGGETPVLGVSAGLLALSVALFVNGYWFT